jgi:PII-like signaling protein
MRPDLKPATKLTVFVGGDERSEHHPLYQGVLRLLRDAGLPQATLTKGVMSYGNRRFIHTTMNEITIENLPIIVEVVGEQTKVAGAAVLIAELLGEHGLVQLQPTEIVLRASTKSKGETTDA